MPWKAFGTQALVAVQVQGAAVVQVRSAPAVPAPSCTPAVAVPEVWRVSSSEKWMRWMKTIASAAGFVVRPGLWQTLQYGPATRPPPWNAASAPVSDSGLNSEWHFEQFAVVTSSRTSVDTAPVAGT
jgi:hypothetical protein